MPDVRPQPAAPSRAPAPSKATVGGALTGVALAASLVVGALKADEGVRHVDYLDLAKVPTACYGHTGPDVRIGQQRTDAECSALLAGDAHEAMDGVLTCTPQLLALPYQLAAATRLAYNIGMRAYCHSGTASAFARFDYRRGCDLMLAWDKAHVGGKLVRVPGLAARRQRERAMCLVGLAA